MKKLIIMRGLPGSGKSTRVEELLKQFKDEQVTICSADSFFTNKGTGEYKFNPKQLGAAHGACKYMANADMLAGVPVIIIDNTNTQKWEYQPYLDMAKEFGYEVEIVMVGNLTDIDLYAQRNTHGVPREAIERMAKRFEP